MSLFINPPNMRSLVVIGRRWFQRGPGNTYHSAEIIIDGNQVHKIDYAYGYGDQYLWNAFEWLEKEGYLATPRHRSNGGVEAPWRWAERNNVQLAYNATDVQRKKDL